MFSPSEIETLPIDALIPYARNARTHSETQVAQVAASIKEFGWTNPVLIDKEGGIIAGHGRVLAARLLNITEIPCIRLDHLNEPWRRAYIIADNKLAMNAGWDEQLLALELEELSAADFNIDLTGFNPVEIEMLLAPASGDRGTPDGSTREIDPDDYTLAHRCPRCGFEFDDKADK